MKGTGTAWMRTCIQGHRDGGQSTAASLYRVTLLPQSRGWDTLTFEGEKNTEQFWAGNSYRPEMHPIMGSFDWERAQIIKITQSEAELTLEPGKQHWVSVQAVDEYAEAKGILFCPTSSELELKIPAYKNARKR